MKWGRKGLKEVKKTYTNSISRQIRKIFNDFIMYYQSNKNMKNIKDNNLSIYGILGVDWRY